MPLIQITAMSMQPAQILIALSLAPATVVIQAVEFLAQVCALGVMNGL